ncbi:ABC transporter substrate-binding protein [Variovorax guangxiensis]|uniref:ABC transporter substrate-binding protein n=1 Tax=Variovorax guangxiensis TaxID=1775474 RepID=UPI0028679F8B|nr:ABC transporter substrate-binding protein [Variovorax guangxiensis]MDR6854726.1 ABC-type branched-subunit amino acid transport system substrate-binding protein [Variovorax guangxiensis]
MDIGNQGGRRFARWSAAYAAVFLAASASWGAAAEPIVIGQVAPFTGPQAVTGRAIHAGAKLYFDAINAKGGVRGRPVKLVTRDDAQKAEDTVRLTREIIAAESPVALMGTVGTTNLEAIAKDGVLAQTGVAMIGAVSGASTVAQAPGIYVVKASYHDEVERLFSQLATVGVQRVGLVYQDDGLGRDVLAGAEAAAKAHGMQLVVRAGYPRNTVAVEKAVAEIAKAKVQVVFLGATTAAGIEFVKQYSAAGGAGSMLYGLSIIDTDALLKALGPERARGYAFSVVLPQQADRAVVREYLQLRQASKDPDLSARSMEGFIAAKALVKVMEGANTLSAAGVGAALASAKAVDVGGYLLDFSTRGQTASRYVDFAMFGARGKLVQ